MSGRYDVAKLVFNALGLAGGLAAVAGFGFAVAGLVVGFGFGIDLWAALMVAVGGLVAIAIAQAARANVDTAEAARALLEMAERDRRKP